MSFWPASHIDCSSSAARHQPEQYFGRWENHTYFPSPQDPGPEIALGNLGHPADRCVPSRVHVELLFIGEGLREDVQVDRKRPLSRVILNRSELRKSQFTG